MTKTGFSYARSIRQRIVTATAETLRFHARHGARNGWAMPSEAEAKLHAMGVVFVEVAGEQRRRIAAGVPVDGKVVNLLLKARERGLLPGYPEMDVAALRRAVA